MSSYKSFAIVGFGVLGALFVDEFLKNHTDQGYKLRVLTRSTKDNLKPELQALSSKGVDVISVDYSSKKSITDALKGSDVVLSALRDDGLDIQNSVVYAAKAAEVKLFVPSEYGANTIGNTSEYLKVKADTQALLKEVGLPYTLFFTGMWPELIFPDAVGPHVGINLEAGKFTFYGNGTSPQSWTSPRSFVPFVHHVLTTLPPSQLENKVFEIEGDRKSFRELANIWEKKHGRRAEVIELSAEEIETYIQKQTMAFFKVIPRIWENGDTLVTGEGNKFWPEWKPLTWEDHFMP
ncbi:NAD-P-binding protein [Ramaria rubella]|nr:NAD-P-binding protein [Ramaria rubella]